MTFRKLLKLYKHFKDNYDFKLSGKSYHEVEEQVSHEGEFLPD